MPFTLCPTKPARHQPLPYDLEELAAGYIDITAPPELTAREEAKANSDKSFDYESYDCILWCIRLGTVGRVSSEKCCNRSSPSDMLLSACCLSACLARYAVSPIDYCIANAKPCYKNGAEDIREMKEEYNNQRVATFFIDIEGLQARKMAKAALKHAIENKFFLPLEENTPAPVTQSMV